MAKHETTHYTCDRCGYNLGPERPRRTQVATLQVAFHYREGPGPSLKWEDLCDSCDKAVKDMFLTPDRLHFKKWEKPDGE